MRDCVTSQPSTETLVQRGTGVANQVSLEQGGCQQSSKQYPTLDLAWIPILVLPRYSMRVLRSLQRLAELSGCRNQCYRLPPALVQDEKPPANTRELRRRCRCSQVL